MKRKATVSEHLTGLIATPLCLRITAAFEVGDLETARREQSRVRE